MHSLQVAARPGWSAKGRFRSRVVRRDRSTQGWAPSPPSRGRSASPTRLDASQAGEESSTDRSAPLASSSTSSIFCTTAAKIFTVRPLIERKARTAALLSNVTSPLQYGDHQIGRGPARASSISRSISSSASPAAITRARASRRAGITSSGRNAALSPQRAQRQFRNILFSDEMRHLCSVES